MHAKIVWQVYGRSGPLEGGTAERAKDCPRPNLEVRRPPALDRSDFLLAHEWRMLSFHTYSVKTALCAPVGLGLDSRCGE